MQNYIDRYQKGMQHVLGDSGPNPSFLGKGLEQITEELEAKIPLNKLQERRQWRDTRLAALAKLKNDLEKSGQ